MAQREGRSVAVAVYNPVGALVATWPDVAGLPSFGWSYDNTDALTLELGRGYGRAGQPSEGGAGDLASGYRVDITVSDARTRLESSAAAWSPRIYRGTIERLRFRLGTTWTALVTLLPLSRVVGGYDIASASSASAADTAVAAQALINADGCSVPWSAANPASSGVLLPAALAHTNTNLLAELVRLATEHTGPHWHCWVSPAGEIRFDNDQAATTTVHTLAAGVEAVNLEWGPDTASVVRRVRIAYETAAGVKATTAAVTADDFSDGDPRGLVIAWPNKLEAAVASAVAANELAKRGRVLLTGECDVLAARYPVESIDLGHRIRLSVPRPLPLVADPYDINSVELVVAAIRHDIDSVHLTFDVPPPDLAAGVLAVGREGRRLAAAVRA